MPRNLDRRVEASRPSSDPSSSSGSRRSSRSTLADDVLAWELRPDGWRKVRTKAGMNAQERLLELAEQRASEGA